MKKIVMIFSFLLFLNVPQVLAVSMWDTPQAPIQNHQLTYLAVRDEYQLRYAIAGLPSGTYQVRANYWTSTNVYYSVVFDNPTGVAYITCNGTYIFEILDANGSTIKETTKIVTHKIKNPTCSSYENSGLKKENFNGYYDSDSKTLYINNNNNFDYYKIYKDGEWTTSFVPAASDITDVDFSFSADGAYTVTGHYGTINNDTEDTPVQGYIDFFIGGNDENLNDEHNDGGNNGGGGDTGGGNDGGGSGNDDSCYDGCKWITDALNCPAWDEYMGEWKSMLQEVYQPPDWQQVANVMRDTIVPAIGEELLNKAPQIAEIFADEFTSREKPVAPAPTTPPTYTPIDELPQLEDIPQEIEFDLSNDIPSFEPDYSESQPFDIPNPFDLQLDDNDLGYIFQTVETDEKTYELPPIDENEEAPQYNIPTNTEMPEYNIPTNNDMPQYNVPDTEIRYYEGGE